MSILRYFKREEHPLLPKDSTNPATRAANKAVIEALATSSSGNQVMSKRGQYKAYDETTRARIGRYAAENGNKAAVEKFSAELGYIVPESTVRGMKTAYLRELKKAKDSSGVKTLPHQNKGRPLKLGKYDEQVREYIRSLRLAGGIVSRSIVVSAAKGIIQHYDPSYLQEHGGELVVDDSWAKSLLNRMGYVKRKGTKAARKLPPDFTGVKSAFNSSFC